MFPNRTTRAQLSAPVGSTHSPLPGPSHTQDKATVRADLDSLRNIANSAARSAIAKYTSKSTREKILFRTLLLTIAFVLAATLYVLIAMGARTVRVHRLAGGCLVCRLGNRHLPANDVSAGRGSKTSVPVKRSAEEGEPESGKALVNAVRIDRPRVSWEGSEPIRRPPFHFPGAVAWSMRISS